MSNTAIDEALTLRAVAESEWNIRADERYEANTGMFGGWTAAVLLKSVLDDTRAQGTVSALTVHYAKRIPPGSELVLRTRIMGGSRSLGYWQTELSLAGDAQVAAFATVLLASRRASDLFSEPVMPEAPAPESLANISPPGTFGERTLQRMAVGMPIFNQTVTRSLAWVRETSGRAIDAVQLAYLADAYAPRIFFKSPGPRPSSTITMSVYFHATEAELRDVGDDYVLSEAIGTRAEHSTVGSQVRLWSRMGTLLATSEQLCWFR